MKKILCIFLGLFIFGLGFFMLQVNSAETSSSRFTSNNETNMKVYNLINRYIEDFHSCKTAHFYEDLDLFGFKLSFRISLNGWKNNKCVLEMSGNVGGLGKNVQEIFTPKIDDNKIATIKPQIKCGFSEKDLDYITNYMKEKTYQNVEKYKALHFDKKSDINLKDLSDKQKEIGNIMKRECILVNKDEFIKSIQDL